MDSGLFTIKTLAQRWGVHPATVRKMVRQGDIAHFRVGNEIRFNNQTVMEYEGWKQALSWGSIEVGSSPSGTSQ